jgi:hypothetical protein
MAVDISLVLAVIICIELVLWTIFMWRQSKKILLSRMYKAKVIKCDTCSYVYFISSNITFSRCPVCVSINKLL